MTLEELVTRYKEGKTSFTTEEQANLEDQIWDLARHTEVAKQHDKHARELTLTPLLGETQSAIHRRSLLFAYGAHARPIWDRINLRKMTISCGINIMQEAKHIMVDYGVDMDVAVKQALDVYDSRPYVRLTDGVPTRMGTPRKKGSPPGAKRKAIRGKPKVSAGADTILVSKIRKEISQYLSLRLHNVDPILKEQLIRETAVEVRILLRDFDVKARRLIGMYDAAAKADAAVSLKEVGEACHTLNMDPPSAGKPVDMDLAKKQKKRLARLYHPDAHSGEDAEHMRAKFDTVMSAFERLEQYNENLKKPTGKENTDNGSKDGDPHDER